MADALRPLLCQTQPYADESLSSLIARLAQLNCYEPPSLLVQLCRGGARGAAGGWEDLDSAPSAKTLLRIASLTCVEPLALYQATGHRFAAVLEPDSRAEIALDTAPPWPALSLDQRNKAFMPRRVVQFCPHCLVEQPYHRISWMLMLVAACWRHRCFLSTTCPGATCQKQVTVDDVVRATCSACGTALTEGARDLSQDDFGLSMQRMLDGIFAEAPWVDARYPLFALPPPTFYRLLRGLYQCCNAMEDDAPFLHAPQLGALPIAESQPLRRYRLMISALKPLVAFPTGWDAFLDACRRPVGFRPGRRWKTLTDTFGTFYEQYVDQEWQEPYFTPLRDASIGYLSRALDIALTEQEYHRYQAHALHGARFAALEGDEAAALLGVSSAVLQRLIWAGAFAGTDPFMKTTSGQPLLRREEVLAFQRQLETPLTLQEASTLLGCNEKTAGRILVQDGRVVLPGVPAAQGGDTKPPVTRLAFYTWLGALTERLQPHQDRPMSALPVLAALKLARRIPRLNLQEAVAAIVEGRLAGYALGETGSCPTLSTLAIDPALLDTLAEGVRPGRCVVADGVLDTDLIPLEEAAIRLGVPADEMQGWVTRGWIRGKKVRGNSKCSRTALEQLAARLIWSDEAAAQYGIPEAAIVEWARARQIQVYARRGHEKPYSILCARDWVSQLASTPDRVTPGELARLLGVMRAQLVRWIDCGWLASDNDTFAYPGYTLAERLPLLLAIPETETLDFNRLDWALFMQDELGWLTTEDAAEAMGLSREHFHDWIFKHKVRPVAICRMIRYYRQSDLEIDPQQRVERGS